MVKKKFLILFDLIESNRHTNINESIVGEHLYFTILQHVLKIVYVKQKQDWSEDRSLWNT